MRNVNEVMADINKRYDAYNEIHQLLTESGWECVKEWDGTVSIGGSFKNGWQSLRVDTHWEDDRIRLTINREHIRDIDWDYLWETKVSTILETLS